MKKEDGWHLLVEHGEEANDGLFIKMDVLVNPYSCP